MKKWKPWLPLFLAVSLLMIAEFVKPRPIDWKPSFSLSDKIPFGSSVLFELSGDLFAEDQVNVATTPLYNFLSDSGKVTHTSYFIFNYDFDPDKLDRDALFNFIENGNQALIAATQFGDAFLDSLKIKNQLHLSFDSTWVNLQTTTVSDDSGQTYAFKTAGLYWTFDSLKSDSIKILGVDGQQRNVFIRINLGKGQLYLHSVPYIFTNYNLLRKDNHKYVSAILSNLPAAKLIWDEYYKSGRMQVSKSPLTYVLNQPPLKWAYFLAIAGIILFIFSEGRRRQRIIPVINPLSNQTKNFVKTIGRLHYQQGNHGETAHKIKTFLLEFIRQNLKIDITDTEEKVIYQINLKTNIPENELSDLFKKLNAVSDLHYSAEMLQELNKAAEHFYNKCKGSQV